MVFEGVSFAEKKISDTRFIVNIRMAHEQKFLTMRKEFKGLNQPKSLEKI